MSYKAVMKVVDNRVAKYMPFATLDEAKAHIEKFKDRYPDAFVVDADKIGTSHYDWWVEGTTVTVVPLPVLEPPPVRDMQAELDELKARLAALEGGTTP